MEDRKVSTKKIHGELKKVKGIVTTTDEFYDRFYLIHGIYGHALKTITMGDESYFSAKTQRASLLNNTIIRLTMESLQG
jgi:cyanate lyase